MGVQPCPACRTRAIPVALASALEPSIHPGLKLSFGLGLPPMMEVVLRQNDVTRPPPNRIYQSSRSQSSSADQHFLPPNPHSIQNRFPIYCCLRQSIDSPSILVGRTVRSSFTSLLLVPVVPTTLQPIPSPPPQPHQHQHQHPRRCYTP